MLSNANEYEKQIKIECIWNRDLPRNKYYIFNTNGSIDLNENNEYIEMVSVDPTDFSLVGFMRYRIKNNCATNIETINFYTEKQIIFAKDLLKFLKQIFTKHKLDKAKFSIHKLNESYKSEETFIEKWGGTKTERADTNWVFFEVTKENYFARINRE